MPDDRQPKLIAHADWSTKPNKRWGTIALRSGPSYRIERPTPVGDVTTFIERLKDLADGGQIAAGFDFPIGIPLAYANLAGVTDFLDFLKGLGRKGWEEFFEISETPDEINVHRPFYPKRPGSTAHIHLVNGLGVGTMDDLLRKCERAYNGRKAACALFWTLGGNQVGRAAISGWCDVLIPAILNADISPAIWPFQGNLIDLLDSQNCIFVETYPAEACLHLGCEPPGRGWSKRKQADRMIVGIRLLNWAVARGVTLSDSLVSLIEDGFGPSKNGEDPFDSVLGIMSMLEVILGHRSDGAPKDQSIIKIEGWIFGQNPIFRDVKAFNTRLVVKK